MNKIEGYETISPAIPRELRKVNPETLAFLRLMWDMGARGISQGHLVIKTALFECLLNPEFLERSEEYIYLRLGKLRRIKPETAETSLRFALAKLWADCDTQMISQTYFADSEQLPKLSGNIELLRVLAQMYRRLYAEYME